MAFRPAVAREHHVARAAQARHLAQPALSEAIRELEDELDVPLDAGITYLRGLLAEGFQEPWRRSSPVSGRGDGRASSRVPGCRCSELRTECGRCP
ncbi:LysR family transcriptional regulator [Streptomyces sp. NPDC047974]|uniref:helix-turn-helix domain-containing protein n=1 Tax=Streptomyces sp. NPDC047974 TaxID=3154343 RepID=UPI00340EE876